MLRMKKLILGTLFATVGFGAAHAAPVYYGGMFYDIVATNFTTRAAAVAGAAATSHQGETGSLASVQSRGLNDFLVANLFNQSGAGFNGASTAVWLDGNTVTGAAGSAVRTSAGATYGFTNFHSGEPNNGAGSQVFIVTSTTGGPFGYTQGNWFDNTVNSTAGINNAYALVQYNTSIVPVPASMPLVLTGLGALAFFARRKAKAKRAAA